MRPIAPQQIDLQELFAQCAAQKQSASLRERLVRSEPAILYSAQQYRLLAQTMTIYQFAPPAAPFAATAEEMVNLYESTFARRGGAGRWAYDRIKAAAPLGVCPLCGQRPVSTLDHYLPKSSHWVLALTPDNLVPCCMDCNWAKDDAVPLDEGTQSFHPYFDAQLSDDQWLFACVHRRDGLSIGFEVRDVPQWSFERQCRARYHFELFKLGTLYATQAAVELVNMRHRLVQLFGEFGPEGVRTHLAEEAASRSNAHVNSWQTALYQALTADDGFCERDFALI